MAIDIGRIAYEKYSRALCVLLQKCNCKPWEDLRKNHQDAWRSAAVAVLQYIDSDKENIDP
jgi:hypothetical protein